MQRTLNQALLEMAMNMSSMAENGGRPWQCIPRSVSKRTCPRTSIGTPSILPGLKPEKCDICIFMGKTRFDGPRHSQQSMILVPMKSPGVEIVRALSAYGQYDAPGGHAEVNFDNVRVPASNLLVGEGKGFAIAQGRLGPGRIHHCMRLIGNAERSLELMIQRLKTRVAFGKPIAEQGVWQERVGLSRIEIEQVSQFYLLTHLLDIFCPFRT